LFLAGKLLSSRLAGWAAGGIILLQAFMLAFLFSASLQFCGSVWLPRRVSFSMVLGQSSRFEKLALEFCRRI